MRRKTRGKGKASVPSKSNPLLRNGKVVGIYRVLCCLSVIENYRYYNSHESCEAWSIIIKKNVMSWIYSQPPLIPFNSTLFGQLTEPRYCPSIKNENIHFVMCFNSENLAFLVAKILALKYNLLKITPKSEPTKQRDFNCTHFAKQMTTWQN